MLHPTHPSVTSPRTTPPSSPVPDEVEDSIYEGRLLAALQDLDGATVTAQRAIYTGLRALTVLTGELYDIELVEGSSAGDIEHELNVAARALRNVTRAVELRKAIAAAPAKEWATADVPVPTLDDWRARRCTIDTWERAMAEFEPTHRMGVLALMGVDEVEALLEVSFLSGDRLYRNQVLARLDEIDPERAAGPLRAAAERDEAAGL